MRRLLQPSYECFGMHLGRFELVPVPVAPSRLPVPLALSTRRPTAVDTFTGISQILLRLYFGDLAECFRLHRVYTDGTTMQLMYECIPGIRWRKGVG